MRAYPQGLGILLSSFNARPFQLASLDETDLLSIAATLARYQDSGIQLADVALVHLANREEMETVFTMDRRDFGVLRLVRGKKFRVTHKCLCPSSIRHYFPHSV